MPSRSTRWNIKPGERVLTSSVRVSAALMALALVSTPLAAAEISPRMAEKYASEIDYAVVTLGKRAPLPPVTVVSPSAPPPVYEVVIAPDEGVQITGEDLVFAQIMQEEADLGCKPGEPCEVPMEPDISSSPGDSLIPEAPFGSRRSVIEL